MSWTTRILATLAFIFLAVGVIWWVAIRDTGVRPPPAPPPSSNTQIEPVKTSPPPAVTQAAAPLAATNIVAIEVPAAATNPTTNWEDRVDAILDSPSEVNEKAKQMLELLPHLPEAGQVETAQHVANLLADEDYAKFGAYLTNTTTSINVQDIVLADVLNRPNQIKLPLLLETARNPANAKATEAREMLALYLEEDYGDDWQKWATEMEKWLKENPD